VSSDDELVARLRRIAQAIDAPSDLVAETARAAFSTRRLDEELAALLHDSDLASPQQVRGAPAGPRSLAFATAAVDLQLQIERAPGGVTVSGVVSGASGDATIETTAASYPAQIDNRGWFRVADLRPGALRVHVTAADGTRVTTSWISA
jgi:hypothetical protein